MKQANAKPAQTLLRHTASALAVLVGLSGVAHAETARANPYMGAAVDIGVAPNGAIARADLLERMNDAAFLEPEILEPAPGVYVFGGYAVAPIAIIETDEGLIAFDTGDAKHDGELLLEAIRTVSDKPIKAIIYGHSHTVHGAGVFAEGAEDVMIIAKPGLNEEVTRNLQSSGIPAIFPETGPYLSARAVVQFNGFMPDHGPDAWASPINIGEMETAFIPANTLVEDGQELTVLGQKMQFFTKYGTDDKFHTTVWLPERKILLTTMLWSSPPQLYSLRGDSFRDPREWIAGLRQNLDLEPDVLISAAARPVVGKDNIKQTLQDYMDGTMFMLDQSLRGILRGLGPDDLRHFVAFPDYLHNAPANLQSYGEISTYAPAIFYHAIGWYDNDAANLKIPAPAVEAKRYLELIGGRDAVISAAQEALDKHEFAWAARLVNHVYILDDQDLDARRIKAKALRQMAYVTTGGTDRSHMMTQALALEGTLTVPRLIPPAAEVVATAPTVFVDFLRVRLDHNKSGDTDKVLRFEFDNGDVAALHIRRAVAEFIAEPDTYDRPADITLHLSAQDWHALYLNATTVNELVNAGKATVSGEVSEADRLINMFDRFDAASAVIIPPVFEGN